MTLRAYIGVLKLEDKLRDHPFYSACAKLAIEIYVYLHDNPSAKSAKLNGPTAPEEQLSASELKKLHRKQKKAQLKAQAAKAAEEKTRESKTHGKGGGGEEDKKVEEREPKFDPDKLLQTDKPLEEAVKFLVPLQTLSPGNVATHTLAYEIHSRRRRFLRMLQALKRLHAIDPDDGDFHRILVDFVLTEQLSASELKKLHRKQKKAQLKAQAAKAAEEKTRESKTHGKGGGGEEDKKVEEREPKFDPDKLLQTDKPLEEAVKFLVPLQTLSPGNVATHTLAYEIHSRRRRFLRMLQALKRLHAIDPDDGDFHRILVDFVLTVETTRASLPEPVLEVITGTLPGLTGGLELTQLNQRFLDEHQHSLPHLIPGCRALYRLYPDAKERALSCICSLSDKLRGRTLKRCIEIHSLLQSGEFGDYSDHIKSYARSCSALFPLATTFKPTEPPDKQKAESRNEPLASNSIDQDLSSATEQRLNLD
jgi:peptide alpha-N-acetyltransferase